MCAQLWAIRPANTRPRLTSSGPRVGRLTLSCQNAQAENQALQELVKAQAESGSAAAERLTGLKERYQQLTQRVRSKASCRNNVGVVILLFVIVADPLHASDHAGSWIGVDKV